MLSARSLAIHDDVRNNGAQELNLSDHRPTFPIRQPTHKNVQLSFAWQMHTTGKAIGVRSWPHQFH
jgi:hypothetical protein